MGVFIVSKYIMRIWKIVSFVFVNFVILVNNFSIAKNFFVRSLLWTQLEIWLNQRSETVWNFVWKDENALTIYKQNEYLNNYDLISELDKAESEDQRLEIIDNYVVILSNVVENNSKMYEYEQEKIDFYKNEATVCEWKIKEKNSDFLEAVKLYNYEKAESVAEEIAELRACIAKNQVYAKAHASYASASRSSNILQKKIKYLSENREKIAKYYDILKPDLLKELYDISQKVNNNF